MIRWFKNISKDDFSNVGGKAYNLAALYNADINIPNGFVITSEAYEQYISDNNLNTKINYILNGDNKIKVKSDKIQELFIEDNVSESLVMMILKELTLGTDKSYAVRSSSTVEDLPGMSFAGQYSSYLNVHENDVIKYMIECWKSLWNARAIEYRDQNNVTKNFTHCVVIQEMIDASVSGVAFTAHPVSGIRNQLFINSSYGLGEAIVSGVVNPDQYIVDKNSGKIINSEILKKEKKCIYSHSGIKTIDVDKSMQKENSLNEIHLQKLVDASIAIEKYFVKPQDIEFSFDKSNNLFILQSRDITTLFPIDNLDHDNKLRMYMTASTVLLGMKEALTPLGADLYGGMFPKVISVMTNRKKSLDDNFVKYEAARILVDVSYLMSSKFVSKQFAKAFSGSDMPLSAVFNQVIKEHGYTFRHQGIRFKIPWGMMSYALSFIGKMKKVKKIEKDQKYNAVKELGKQFYSERLEKSKALDGIEEKWQFCEETMLEVFKLTQVQALYCTEVGNYAKIKKSIFKILGDQFNLDVLGYSLPDCYTVDMGLELNFIAKYLTEKNEILSVNHPKVKGFLDLYGVRAQVELDFGHKRWREDPTFILDQIANYMTDRQYEKNIKSHLDKKMEAEKMVSEITQAFSDKKGEKAARKINETLNDYRRAAGMREYPKFNIVQGLDLMRQVFLDEGKQQVELGRLEFSDDIFYLYKHELADSSNWKSKVKERKENYQKEMKRNSIPRVVLNSGETIYSANIISKDAKTLQGYPLSSGIYEGRIRIVHDPSNHNLKEGEIMVAESTNPAWTPLFMIASALITEYGGPLSHGGIVAREYGIPAVVGISSINSLLVDGQLVRINGDSGTVEILG